MKHDGAMPNDPMSRAEDLAAEFTALSMKDGRGSAVRWYAREINIEGKEIVLLTATENFDDAEDIAEAIYISGLVMGDEDIRVFKTKGQENCIVTIIPDRIDRAALERLAAGKKAAPVQRKGFIFN